MDAKTRKVLNVVRDSVQRVVTELMNLPSSELSELQLALQKHPKGFEWGTAQRRDREHLKTIDDAATELFSKAVDLKKVVEEMLKWKDS